MRNPFCSRYERCLDRYAKLNSPDWDCSACHRAKEYNPEPITLEACILLLWALFRPKLWQEFLRWKARFEPIGECLPEERPAGLMKY